MCVFNIWIILYANSYEDNAIYLPIWKNSAEGDNVKQKYQNKLARSFYHWHLIDFAGFLLVLAKFSLMRSRLYMLNKTEQSTHMPSVCLSVCLSHSLSPVTRAKRDYESSTEERERTGSACTS